MHRRTTARFALALGLVVTALLLAASSSWAAPPVPSRAAPATTAVRAPAATAATTTTTARPRTIYISLSHDIVTMPTTVRAGTYYVQVRTTDAANGVTVVRPPSTLTPSTFYARFRAISSATGSGVAAAIHRYRTSATFVGGTRAEAGHVGAFAIRLSPGRYFFFSAAGSDPLGEDLGRGVRRYDPGRVKVVTVVGPAPAALPVATVGVARLGIDWARSTSVSLPTALPRRGFLLTVGGRGLTSDLWVRRILPGVTDPELHDGTCLAGGLQPPRDCFDAVSAQIGGAVSPGASAWFYYDLPPGDYAVGSGDHNDNFDWFFIMGLVQRVHVS